MKVIVGLGNPDKSYQFNRHNVGFIVIDAYAKSRSINEFEVCREGRLERAFLKLGQKKVELIKPRTFMNNSGHAVRYAKENHTHLNNSDICVIHDDLDIHLGSYKLQMGKGPRQHLGVASIEKQLVTKDFWRLRVGIENRCRTPVTKVSGQEYVLSDFSDDERKILDEVTAEKIIPELNRWIIGAK